MENHESQEIKRKKQSLKRYRKNVACIVRLERKRDLLDMRIKSIKSPNLSGMPRGGKPVTLDDLIADKTDLEDRIKRLKKKGYILKREILAEIDSLEEAKYCSVLESFFIDCLSIEEIAENEGYSDRYIYKLYEKGISLLTVKGQ